MQLVVHYPADFNFDSRVDRLDGTVLAGYWRQACAPADPCAPADLHEDRTIDVADLLLAEQWLETGP